VCIASTFRPFAGAKDRGGEVGFYVKGSNSRSSPVLLKRIRSLQECGEKLLASGGEKYYDRSKTNLLTTHGKAMTMEVRPGLTLFGQALNYVSRGGGNRNLHLWHAPITLGGLRSSTSLQKPCTATNQLGSNLGLRSGRSC